MDLWCSFRNDEVYNERVQDKYRGLNNSPGWKEIEG